METGTEDLKAKVSRVIPAAEWEIFRPYVEEINKLKKLRNAVIMAHNYQTPEIFLGVADFRGDSLQLAQEATKTDADVIVLCGVHFMAETAKILNPKKKVLIPDPLAGCSLAASITGNDVRALRKKYPGVPVVAYVNTTADVKAEVDICCTSSNAVEIVQSLGVPEVIFLPDQYLASWVASQTKVKIIPWKGSCEVHERFSADDIATLRESHPGIVVAAHPECPPEVLAAADYVGSTSGMIKYAKSKKSGKLALITECSMSDNVAAELPEVEFIRPCNLCPHMKRITLPKIAASLRNLTHEVIIEPELAARARRSVERMLEVKIGRLQ